MKKILIIASMTFICAVSFGQAKKTTTKTWIDSTKKTTTVKAAKATTATSNTADKYHDNVDDRMKGPKGEKVYIGPNGGRYYLNAAGNKVYVPYAGNKKPVAKP